MEENSSIQYNDKEILYSMRGKHDDSLWHVDSSISMKTDENTIIVTKEEGIIEEQIFYPNILLNGDFEISMDIKITKGSHVTYVLNRNPSYGGTITGWRNMPEWTSLRIIRTRGIVEVYYDNPDEPQAIYRNSANGLYFFIRFNGLYEENTIYLKNFNIYENNQIKFLDTGVGSDFEFVLREINSAKERVIQIRRRFDEIEEKNKNITSLDNLMNFLSLDAEIKPKENLKFAQNLSQKLLDFIVGICDKYQLEYWLDYGTLLGAVRHGNFIPWDHNVQIAMLRKDFNKLLDILDEEITSKFLREYISFTIDEISEDEESVRTYLKILFKDKSEHILSKLNIFAYDFLVESNNNTENKYYSERMIFHHKIITGTKRAIVEQELYDNFGLSYEKQDHLIHGVDGIQGDKEEDKKFTMYKTEEVFPLKTIKFNDTYYCCPNNIEEYLKKIYDDYLIPNIKYNLESLNYLRNIKNKEDYYNKYLNMLD